MLQPDVTIVISHFGTGGAQRVISIVANEWARRGLRIEIVTLSDIKDDVHNLDPTVVRTTLTRTRRHNGKNRSKIQNKNDTHVPVWRHRMDYRSFLLSPVRMIASLAQYIIILVRLRHKLKYNRPKLVFALIAPTNILTLLACWRLGLRVAISERNDPTQQSFGFVWDLLRKAIYRRADIVTANSRKALSELGSYVPDSRLAYLPNPLQISTRRPAKRHTAKRILVVGRIEAQKGYNILLKAIQIVLKRHPDWKLIVAGDGSKLASMQRLTYELGLQDSVEWLGYVSEPGVLYEKADIYVLSSRFEGTPNALMEAMNAGLAPIVTANLDGALEFVEQDVTGKVVPAENPVELSRAIEQLIRDPDLRDRLGRSARAKVQSHATDRVMPVWDKVLLNEDQMPSGAAEIANS